MLSTVRNLTTDVLLINPVKGAPGTRGCDDAPVSHYVDTIAPSYLNGHFTSTFPAEPLYFGVIGGQIRAAGYTVEIIDGLCHRLNMEELATEIKEFKTNIYCFAIFHNTVRDSLTIAQQIKQYNPSSTIVFGGTFATNVWKQLLEYDQVDYVVIGDGEIAIVELIRSLLGDSANDVPGVARRKDGDLSLVPSRAITNLDELAMPIRDLAPLVISRGFALSIYSSRGCNFGRCSFCYLPRYQQISNHPLWRGHSASRVVDEMAALKDDWGVNYVAFVDEDFVGPDNIGIPRFLEIANLLIDRRLGMKYYTNVMVRSILALIKQGHLSLLTQSGLDSVFIGFETASKSTLIKYVKPQSPSQYDYLIDTLLDHGIKINPGLITFDPTMTLEDLRANVDLCKKLRYYDLFLFSRALVDLPKDHGDAFKAERNKPLVFENVKHQFTSVEVAIVFTAMRLYIDIVFPVYQEVLRLPIPAVDRLRPEIIQQHYAVFQEFADWAEHESPALVSHRAIEERVLREVSQVKELIDRGRNG